MVGNLLMLVPLDVNKFWQHISSKNKFSSVDIVAKRFLQAFLDHGVKVSQIPRLIHHIKLDDLQSSEKLLAALTPEILDQTAKLFGIRSQWLEGVDDEIYQYLACYKCPEVILEHLAKVVNGNDVGLRFPLRIFSTTKNLDCNDNSQQLLAPVIIEKIAELGEDAIYRYHIYRDGFDWSYLPTRIELKAIARIVYKHLHTSVPLFVISTKEMKDVLEGKLIPKQYLDGCQITSPSLEDYALTKEESVVAKEVEEIPAVLDYIKEHKLQNFTFDIPDTPPPPTDASASSISPAPPDTQEKPKKSGKRIQAQTEIWEPIRNAAKTLWAVNDQLAIAEVIRRIKRMSTFKASFLTESAIRKHIAELAPPHIRGKSGRKPNKPT